MVEQVREAIQLTSWVRERWQNPSTLGLVLLVIFVLGFSVSYQYDFTGITENITWLESSVVFALAVLVIFG
jgi:putative effector of murein hydrolase